MAKYWQQLKQLYERLDERQRAMAAGGVAGGFVLILLIVMVVLQSSASRLEKTLKKNETLLGDIVKLSGEYKATTAKVDSVRNLLMQDGDPSLTTFLENSAKEVGINIESIKPLSGIPNDSYEQSVVEVRIDTINLKELVDLLYKIENHNKLLKVISLKISPKFVNPAQLKVEFKVSSFVEKAS